MQTTVSVTFAKCNIRNFRTWRKIFKLNIQKRRCQRSVNLFVLQVGPPFSWITLHFSKRYWQKGKEKKLFVFDLFKITSEHQGSKWQSVWNKKIFWKKNQIGFGYRHAVHSAITANAILLCRIYRKWLEIKLKFLQCLWFKIIFLRSNNQACHWKFQNNSFFSNGCF